jgi:hypothetical protein
MLSDDRRMPDEPPPGSMNEAQRLAQLTRPVFRRYAGFQLLFAAGALVAPIAYGALGGGAFGLVIALLLVGAPLTALVLAFRREPKLLRRFALLHGMVIATWAGLWIITIVLGSMAFLEREGWWVGGGIVCALPAAVGAIVVLRAAR